jgi:hypothetical protein
VHRPCPAEKSQSADPGRLHFRRGHRHRRPHSGGIRKKIPGTTKLIIAQRISSVEYADRILVLDGGRIDGFDTHENLLKSNAIYREIYDSQIKGGGDFDQPA